MHVTCEYKTEQKALSKRLEYTALLGHYAATNSQIGERKKKEAEIAKCCLLQIAKYWSNLCLSWRKTCDDASVLKTEKKPALKRRMRCF